MKNLRPFRAVATVFLLALIAALAPALPARAGNERFIIYNTTNNKAWITIYRSDVGRTIVCSGWAEAKKWKECNPWFFSIDNAMWVRVEVVNGSDKVIRDFEIKGSPRTLGNTTIKYENGDFRIDAGAPQY